MASPFLNEYALLNALDPGGEIPIDQLHIVLGHMLLNAHDRKLDRLPFYEIAQTVLETAKILATMEFAAPIRDVYREHNEPSLALEEGLKSLGKKLTRTRLVLMKQLAEIMECAESTDKIN